MGPHYIAVCAIFRDEAPYLAEWISFHQLMGVEHFFLYNNYSSDNPEIVLQPYLEAGSVTLLDWPTPFHERAQAKAYAHCLDAVRGRVRWLACIDIDEFLFAPGDISLPAVLAHYEQWPGVVVHWQTYGSSGQLRWSRAPVIERFVWRAHTDWIRNRKVKSIVNPERTEKPLGVHHFSYRDNALAVDENQTPVHVLPRPRYKKRLKPLYGRLGPLLKHLDPYSAANISSKVISADRLRINHYPVRSREEFLMKTVHKKGKRRYEDIDYFAYHDRNDVHDLILNRYLPELYRCLERPESQGRR